MQSTASNSIFCLQLQPHQYILPQIKLFFLEHHSKNAICWLTFHTREKGRKERRKEKERDKERKRKRKNKIPHLFSPFPTELYYLQLTTQVFCTFAHTHILSSTKHFISKGFVTFHSLDLSSVETSLPSFKSFLLAFFLTQKQTALSGYYV